MPPPRISFEALVRIIRKHYRDLTIVKTLGAGAFGICALVQDSQGYLFAAKIQPRADGRHEGRRLTAFQHPRIISLRGQVMDHVEHNLSILVLEYAPFGTLHALMKRFARNGAKMPEALLWQVGKDLAEALVFLRHGSPAAGELPAPDWRGPAAHCDIKPANILLRAPASRDEYPRAVLADFGLAEWLPEEGGALGARGTLGYVAPERRTTTKSDVYALGKTLYVCAIGHEPESGVRVRSLVDLGYSPDLDEMVHGALHADPRWRTSAVNLYRVCKTVGAELFGRYFKPLKSWAYPSDYQE